MSGEIFYAKIQIHDAAVVKPAAYRWDDVDGLFNDTWAGSIQLL